MANTGKSEHTEADRQEYRDLVAALAGMTPEARSLTLLSPVETAALLRVSIGTLDRARTKRKNCLAQKVPIEPLSLASIPFSQPEREGLVRYFALHVSEFLGRWLEAADPGRTGRERPPETPLPVLDMDGIRRWMSDAGPADTWPFAIRADGRPVDMMRSLARGELTGAAARLTLREFAELLAHASSAAFHARQAGAVQAAAGGASSGDDDPSESRWDRSGGPL